MKCVKCGFEGHPNLEETGPHTKATCQKCGSYIKMLNKKELEEQTQTPVSKKTDIELILTLKTTNITIEEIPGILDHIKQAIMKGYTSNVKWNETDNKEYKFNIIKSDSNTRR